MKVRSYIDLIKGLDDNIGEVIALLKQSGASESEAVLALMVTREISMDEAQAQIARTSHYATSRPDAKASRNRNGRNSGTKASHP